MDEVIRQGPAGDLDSFRKAYAAAIDQATILGDGIRDPMWTKPIAVGTEAYIGRIQNAAGPRREVLDVEEKPNGVWTLRESQAPYSSVSCPKTAAKPQNQARNLV